MGAASAPASLETALPPAGLAVQTRRGVDLVSLDGKLVRTLAGYRFRLLGVERLGQVELRAPSGAAYELRAGRLVAVPASAVTLPFGWALRFEQRRWRLLRDGRVVALFPRFTHVELDDSGTVLTALRLDARGVPLAPPVTRDLRTGTRRALAAGCRVAVARRGLGFELCGRPWGRGPTRIVRVTASGRRTLTGPPSGASGWWQSASLSPDGTKLLAQWSGECESPSAYLVDGRTGRLTALGRTHAGAVAEGRAIGWSGARALVALPLAVCGSSAERVGIHAIENGRARLLYALPRDPQVEVRLWR